MPISVCKLPFLGLLEISGVDAGDFLQGQLSGDVSTLDDGHSLFTAWCTATGTVLCTVILTRNASHYYLILPVDLLDSVRRRMNMYILRAKVLIRDITPTHGCLGACLDGETDTLDKLINWDFSIVRVPVPRDPARLILITAHNEMPSLFAGLAAHAVGVQSEHNWRQRDIASALPWIHAQTSEQALPQELNLEEPGGLSYHKGCYPGQEVIARVHFRGRQKRQLCRGHIGSVAGFAVPGTRLPGPSDAQSAGFILYGVPLTDGSIDLLAVVETSLIACMPDLENGVQVHLYPLNSVSPG